MKPNARFAKLDFDDSMIMAQLKCNGARLPLSFLLLWWWCRCRRLRRLWRDVFLLWHGCSVTCCCFVRGTPHSVCTRVLLLWRRHARGGATDARRLPESRAV